MARKSKASNDAVPPAQPASRPVAIIGIAANSASFHSLQRLLTLMPRIAEAALVICLKQADGLSPAAVREAMGAAAGATIEIAEDGMLMKPDHIYIGPAEAIMTVDGEHLRIEHSDQPPEHRANIDSFLTSIAELEDERAVGIILSGLGSDGVAGVTALKENGGLAIAELSDLETPGMDLVDVTGLADFTLPIEQIPDQITAHVRHLAQAEQQRALHAMSTDAGAALTKVAGVLRTRTGHDFHGYKRNTFLRRIQRRMQVLRIDSLDAYIEHLRGSNEEVHHLFQDLLIGVTQFFRDKPEFAKLEQEVIPKLFEGKGAGDQVRIWTLGCATGEEAYSIAMLLREHMNTMDSPPHVQVFATDIDGRALSMARSGRYPESIAKDVPADRLARWFSKEGATYAVSRELREMCIFSQHNVIKDAPFSRIDLISCRNLLIYLNTELQERVIPLFHFALKPQGYLFLGPAENVTRHAKLFSPIDRKHRLFTRLDSVTRVLPEFPLSAGERMRSPAASNARTSTRVMEAGLGRRAERVAERYAPAYVLVDESFDVLHFSGRTGRYLEPSAGAATLNLLNLAHRDLRLDLRAALHAAAAEGRTVKTEGLVLGLEPERRRTDLIVEPLMVANGPRSFVVLFQDHGPAGSEDISGAASVSVLRDEHVQRLEAELRLTKERLQATIEELESTNEELKSSNEEYQSINEELQSANEELETSKEELQSVNEELHTVNGELAHRVQDLARSNSDLKNLLESTQIATIFLDNELRVKSFTPSMAEIFHLVDHDVGRPLTHIASRLTYHEMEEDLRKVLRTLSTLEREIDDPRIDARFLVRVLPYRNTDNFIAGAVLTFLDISAVAQAEAETAATHQQMRQILESIGDAFYALDWDLQFTYANAKALELWNKRETDLLGRRFLEVFPESEAWAMHAEVLSNGQPATGEIFSISLKRWLSVSLYPSKEGLSAFVRDITERRQAEERQKLMMAELQHRVKNILAVVRSIAARTLESSKDLDDFAAHFEGRLGSLARTQGVLARRPEAQISLEELVREELLSHAAQDDEQVTVSGPHVQLGAKAAETFSLALHELATNAIKYGALSAPAGKLSVSWRVFNTSGGPRLQLQWRERGVPVIDPNPDQTGFGRDLIERGLPYELGAATSLEFAPNGVRCIIEAPMAAIIPARAEP